jgi:hypothetical protein
MVVATLFPPSRAQRLAPLPKWATIVRPVAAVGSIDGRTEAMYS